MQGNNKVHIEILVLKSVYSEEFALHHVLSPCEGRPRSPAALQDWTWFLPLPWDLNAGLFPPKYLIGIWTWMDLCLLVTPVMPAVSGTKRKWHFWSCPVSNPAQQTHLTPWVKSQLISWVLIFWRSCVLEQLLPMVHLLLGTDGWSEIKSSWNLSFGVFKPQ